MKVWNYVFIAISMMLFFQFAGYPTAFTGIFGFVNVQFNEDNSINSTSLDFSNFKDYLFGDDSGDDTGSGTGWLATLIGAGIAIGLYASGKPDIAIKAGFATAIFSSFVPTLYFAVTYAIELGVAAWAVGILGMIFIPFSVIFLFALIEYVVGGNTD